MRGPLRFWTKTEIPKPGGRLTVSAGGTTRVGDATGIDVAVSTVGVKVGGSKVMVGCAEGNVVGLGSGTIVGVGISEFSVGCAEGDGVELGSGTVVGAGVASIFLCRKR